MRTIVVLTLLLVGIRTQTLPSIDELKTFSLEEVVPIRPDLFPDRISVRWISESEYLYSDPSQGIIKYDAVTDTFVTILDVLDLFNLSRYSVSSFSKDQKILLLATNKRRIYRYSSIAEYSVYDTENEKLVIPLAMGPLQVVIFGSGRSLAYVKDNNVYYLPDCKHPTNAYPLTTNGVPGEVYNGATDWIYEEEVFNSAEAMWFSPSGKYLAVASFNDTNVSSTAYPYYGPHNDPAFQYPHEIRFKYPKAGRPNPVVGLRVFKPDEPLVDAWNIPAPVDVIGPDHILARVNWATDVNLLILWMNRRQNHSVLISCNLEIDKCVIVKEKTEPNGWIDIDEPVIDVSGTGMVGIEPQYSGSKRYLHAVEIDFHQNERDLTPGNSTVTEVVAWNKKEDTVFYILSPDNYPWLRQLWMSKGNEARCLSCKEPSCNNVNVMMAPRGKYGVLACSSTNSPPTTYLLNTRTNQFKLIKDNTKLVNKLNKFRLPLVMFNKITLKDGVLAHIKLLLPPKVQKGEKYPMILRVYAGPGTVRVKDSFDLEYYNMYLAMNRSFIVASIDVRGSGVMGVEALHAINNALGTVEVTDTLDAIRQLTSLYSFIDPERVGVWGWSYGGFATTMMLIADNNNTIRCGAAVAPVTSWLYYDTIYTERYMDTPARNPAGYQRADVMAAAARLRGRRFLLVHGTGDDNVHYQHSLQLAKVLQHLDIAFEQMSYTDETHSLLGVSRHFYHTLDRFWTGKSNKPKAFKKCKKDIMPYDCGLEMYTRGINAVDPCNVELELEQPRVVIVGAGMAGLAAAERLTHHGIDNYLILEATERPGGRIYSKLLGDVPVELGACHKSQPYCKHPVFDMCTWPHLERQRPHPGLPVSPHTFGLFDRVDHGKISCPAAISAYYKYRSIEKEARSLFCYGASKTQGSLVEFIGSRIQQDLHDYVQDGNQYDAARIMFALAHVNNTRCPTDHGWIAEDNAGVYLHMPGSNARVPLGFSGILAPLLHKIPLGNIRYCKPVNNILWGALPPKTDSDARALVTCCDGETFDADYVITTVSVGVLSRYCNMFCPSLPSSKLYAIQNLGMCHCNKVYLEFSQPFSMWLKTNCTKIKFSGRNCCCGCDWTSGIIAIERVPHSAHTLCVWVSGAAAVQIEMMSGRDIAEGVRSVLAKYTGNYVPCPCAVLRSNWSGSNFYFGAGSQISPSLEGCQRELAAPLPGPCDVVLPILLFAGEATTPGLASTVAGARISGYREAERIMQLTYELKGRPRNKGGKDTTIRTEPMRCTN